MHAHLKHVMESTASSATERRDGFLRPNVSVAVLTLILASVMALLLNGKFWAEMLRLHPDLSARNVGFMISVGVLLILTLNLLLTLFAWKYVLKGVAAFLLIGTAVTTYFMSTYGVLIDSTMMQNVLETDPAEASELLSLRLFLHVFAFGILPAWFVCRIRVRYRPLLGELGFKLGVVGLNVLALCLCVGAFYPDYASFFPEHRQLRHAVTPINYLYASVKFARDTLGVQQVEIRPLGEDATLGDRAAREQRPAVLVLVVGETARAKQFSLNGYERITNESLGKEAVVSFTDVSSCGTSTAIALPCMFSNLTRESYDDRTAKSQQGLLDVLDHASVRVLWRDNNSGCKGACDRVHTELAAQFAADTCDGKSECMDENLLNGLDGYLDTLDEDAVIVLHQKGSHGPAYYLRTPEEFKRFSPECSDNRLQNCTHEEIVNAYDNTILYADYVLGEVIQLLKRHADRLDAGMLYVSDHGESLGEHNLYLHGLPYSIAPDEQKKVPMIAWLSPQLEVAAGVDLGCLAGQRDRPLSHDYLFHSVLGLMDVETTVYDPQLDLFASCASLMAARATDLPTPAVLD